MNDSLLTTEQQRSTDDAPEDWQTRNRREKENHRRRVFIDLIGGTKAFEEFTFDKFLRSWNQQPALEAAMAFNPHYDNLYFWGMSRVGKTHLATAIAHKYFDLGYSIQIITLPHFKDKLRLFESEHNYAEKIKYVNALIEAQILIVHEIGRGKITELIQETMWAILEGRLLAGRNGFIGTGNFSLNDIGKTHGGTISARLTELCGSDGIVRFYDRANT